MRIPDRLFSILARVYLDEVRRRGEELSVRVENEDRWLREHWSRKHADHDSGMCGGADRGCRFYPCYKAR